MATDPSSQSPWKVSHMSESKETQARCALHCCRLVQCSCVHVCASTECVAMFRTTPVCQRVSPLGIFTCVEAEQDPK